jgi:hypothetical protein
VCRGRSRREEVITDRNKIYDEKLHKEYSHILGNDKAKEDERSRTCNTHWKEEEYI